MKGARRLRRLRVPSENPDNNALSFGLEGGACLSTPGGTLQPSVIIVLFNRHLTLLQFTYRYFHIMVVSMQPKGPER